MPRAEKYWLDTPCPNEGCVNLKSKKSAGCGECNRQRMRENSAENNPFWKGGRSVTKAGYVVLSGHKGHPNAYEGGGIMEHVLVMAQSLGRGLYLGESVHHRNGIRHDNRLENLELWTKRQPSGQRVEDMIDFAVSLLTEYSPEKLR